jgi:hypothetical protein
LIPELQGTLCRMLGLDLVDGTCEQTWLAMTSAKETLFLSPPETPRMNSLPTRVFCV